LKPAREVGKANEQRAETKNLKKNEGGTLTTPPGREGGAWRSGTFTIHERGGGKGKGHEKNLSQGVGDETMGNPWGPRCMGKLEKTSLWSPRRTPPRELPPGKKDAEHNVGML